MKKYNFEKGKWQAESFRYVYSPACFDRVAFHQETDCIVNGQGESLFGYEFITMIDKEKLRAGTMLRTECSFEKFGAPLIMITNEIAENEKGEPIYGTYFEVVAFERGINIWRVEPFPENVERPIKAQLLANKAFPILGNTRIEIKMLILPGKIKAWVNGEYLEADDPDIPTEAFWAGITACEGINRFYSFEISEVNET